ncbi:MAG: hypothetical protein HY088_07645 [Ignavibacteriales bacterium]|nr:hypothetical protein [Ignavibacteriales bacterium]
MPEQQVEPEVVAEKDTKSLEYALQMLWEKAHRVSEAIVKLKEENAALHGRIGELEGVEKHLKQILADRERELERVHQEALRFQSNGTDVFTKEEKEALKLRIKELITKINSRL